ncbi:MAG: hypothetical protein IPM13_17720 [Phycisphaerales bacterium]|nr:hypothetical protein [Phycisphaerales bacterium]
MVDPTRLDVIGPLLDLRAQINATLQRLAPGHRATLFGLSDYHSLRARYAQAKGDPEEALRHRRAHLETARQLMARFGDEQLAAVRATDAAYQFAEFLLSCEGPQPARAVVEEMRAVAEALRTGGDDPGRQVAWAFVITDGRVALAEGRFDAAERLARSVADHFAEFPSVNAGWLGEAAAELLDEVARLRR